MWRDISLVMRLWQTRGRPEDFGSDLDRRTAGPPDCAVRFATAKTGRLPADKAARVAHAGVVKETSLLSRIAIRVFLAHALSRATVLRRASPFCR